MTLLRPAPASAADPELWSRVLGAAGAGTLTGDELRETVVAHAVSQLCDWLGDDEALRALADFAEEDDTADGWPGAGFQATQLGLVGPVAVLVLFLISERTTSGAAGSPYARMLAHAAARKFGDRPDPDVAAGHALDAHEATFDRFLDAQRDLTRRLLHGVHEVPLHRAIRTLDLIATEADPRLQPLSSFSTSAAYAVSLAEHGYDARGDGEVVLLSAIVPTARILATPASGSGAVLEHEVVVAAGAAGDRVTVTRPGIVAGAD